MTGDLSKLYPLLSAESVETLWAAFEKTAKTFGFSRLIYGFTRFRTANSLGAPEDLVMLSTLPRSYMSGFDPGGPLFQGPMIHWAQENVGTMPWVDWSVHEEALSLSERRAVEFNRRHNVTCGYTISFPSAAMRFKGGLAVIGDNDLDQTKLDAIWARQGTEFATLAEVFHLKLMSLPLPSGRRLTQRQREVLEWVGDGKTTQDIADILGLTPATVEKHMRLAREAMDVETTAQAVLKAAFQNQMYVLQP